MEVWVSGGRNAVQLIDLKDAITMARITDATVTAQLLDPEDDFSVVTGSAFSLPLVDSSRSKYAATSPVLSLTLGKAYKLEVSALKNAAVIYLSWTDVVAGKGSGAR